jgi:hypothetical protein
VRMSPGVGNEQLELHHPMPSLARESLGEVDESAADTGAALIGSRNELPELARIGGYVVDHDAADDLAVSDGDRDLTLDEFDELSGRRPRGPGAPLAAGELDAAFCLLSGELPPRLSDRGESVVSGV